MKRAPFQKGLTAIRALLTRRLVIHCDGIPFEFHRVPLKKLWNWLLVEASVFVQPSRPWGWPTHVQVEPTNRCNIRCALCPVAQGLNRPAGLMTPATFQKIVDGASTHAFLLLLWDWGEPFLNPHVYDMVAYAAARRIRVLSSTNGHVFADRGQAEKLVRSGIDAIVFAVDGIAQDTYERYRAGGKLADVLTGIRNVVDVKRSLQSAKPLLNLQFIVMKHNEHEVPQLADFARELGVDALTLKTLNPFDDRNPAGVETDPTDFLPADPAHRRFVDDPATKARVRRKHNACKKLWNNPTFHWDGSVHPCSCDAHGGRLLGDITKQSFADIWFGARYRELRGRSRGNGSAGELCARCNHGFESRGEGTDFTLGTRFLRKPS